MMNKFLKNWQQKFSLKDVTRIRIGGPADYFAEVHSEEELIEAVAFCRQNNISFFILGGGTNLFFSDDGFRGAVIKIGFNEIKIMEDLIIQADAGAQLADVVELCREQGLAGFEFAAGIPGTVGGAIYGNAGAYGKDVGDLLLRAKILKPDGKVAWEYRDYFAFSYRHSHLKKSGDILLKAEFKVEQGNREQINEEIRRILKIRSQKLPDENVATAGSYFKNIVKENGDRIAAAVFLEAVGSKKMRIGNAAIFPGHANIVINLGHARAEDVLKLENELKQKVFEKFGIRLEREVIFVR